MDSDTAVLRSTPPSDLGRVRKPRAGGYRVVRRLGQGGSGTVYLALSPSGRRVALKVLDSEASDDDLRRLQREGRLAARLDHPNIVRVHGLGMQAGRAYLVLDLVNGCSLQERLREGPLDGSQTIYLAEKLARALHYAHEQGILHRDIKPSNVLLDRAGEPQLTDFGLAKTVEVEEREPLLTIEGDVLGTPSFMAPEQALGEIHRVDRRADVYGLGATIFAMLTGAPPFKGNTWLHILTAVVHDPAPRPSSRVPLVDPQLEEICLRCLEKDPDLRYPTALDLAKALSACARRLRGATPSVNDLADDALTLRMQRALLPLKSSSALRERKQKPLRPHGESERLLALHTTDSQPVLLLAGEKLRLKGDSGELLKARGRRKAKAKKTKERKAEQPGRPARRSLARRRGSDAGLPLALAMAPLALLALVVAFAFLGSGEGDAVEAATSLDTPALASSERQVLVSDRVERVEDRPSRSAPVVEEAPTPAPVEVEPSSTTSEPDLVEGPAPPLPRRARPLAAKQSARTVPTTRTNTTTTSTPVGSVVLRRGTVTRGEDIFAAGDTLPLQATLRVPGDSPAAELESEGAARVFLAPQTRFSVRTASGQPEFHVERGSLFARSLSKKKPYVIGTPDGVAVPVGTEFLVTVKSRQKTRIATFDGEVRIGGSRDDLALAVRRGFEGGLSEGRVPWLPDALRTSKNALRWLPKAARPRIPSLPRVLRTFTFDNGELGGFGKGTLLKGGALGSRFCLQGEAYKEDDGRSVVRREEDEVFRLERGVWIEAMVRAECATKITFKVWDAKKKKNVHHSVPVEAGRWTPVAMALEDLETSSKSKTALDLTGPCRRFEILAGECKGERGGLLVDNVRFYQQAN